MFRISACLKATRHPFQSGCKRRVSTGAFSPTAFEGSTWAVASIHDKQLLIGLNQPEKLEGADLPKGLLCVCRHRSGTGGLLGDRDVTDGDGIGGDGFLCPSRNAPQRSGI